MASLKLKILILIKFSRPKLFEKILIYYLSYKALIGEKIPRIMFHKLNRFIRAYDRTKYLVLFGCKKM